MNKKESITPTGRRVVRVQLPDGRITWVEYPNGDTDVYQFFTNDTGKTLQESRKRLKANGKHIMTVPVDKLENLIAEFQ